VALLVADAGGRSAGWNRRRRAVGWRIGFVCSQPDTRPGDRRRLCAPGAACFHAAPI